MKSFKQFGKDLLANNNYGRLIYFKIGNLFFRDSTSYWEARYQNNGNSGAGSYGEKAIYKAGFLNRFVKEQEIKTVIEFGCGDGNQLAYFEFPEYKGFDVSQTAINKCRDLFAADKTKSFYGPCDIFTSKAELALSLDVIFHLVEDDVCEDYMKRLFSSATKYVIIYAWDVDEKRKLHVRHRCFSKWINKNIAHFRLLQVTRKAPFCDFYVYERMQLAD